MIWTYDSQALAAELACARLQQGRVLKAAQAADIAGHRFAHVGAADAGGLAEVMHDALHNVAAPLDAARLCRWRSLLFPGGTSGDSGGVPDEVAKFLNWFNQSRIDDGIVRAAIAHLWYETLHPFDDGNGRIGRAIMDMAIAQDTRFATSLYSMSLQLQESGDAYRGALNAARTGGPDITEWLRWFLRQFALACTKSEQSIGQALVTSRFWAEHTESGFSERQRSVLKKLLDAGNGGFLGGLTADRYANITAASKATATRDLTDLLQKQALIVRGAGKATRYFVNVLGWSAK